MPFGLMNAPSTFQRMMNSVLRGLTWLTCLVYQDDIGIFTRGGIDQHVLELACVFERLAAAGLTLKLKKCVFAPEKMEYLGHELSFDGVRPLQRLVSAVQAFPRPTDAVEAKRFVHLAGYYRRFVEGFGSLMSPITKLLLTDASTVGLGACLMQDQGKGWQSIAYASKVNSEAESKYSITELESRSAGYQVVQTLSIWTAIHYCNRPRSIEVVDDQLVMMPPNDAEILEGSDVPKKTNGKQKRRRRASDVDSEEEDLDASEDLVDGEAVGVGVRRRGSLRSTEMTRHDGIRRADMTTTARTNVTTPSMTRSEALRRTAAESVEVRRDVAEREMIAGGVRAVPTTTKSSVQSSRRVVNEQRVGPIQGSDGKQPVRTMQTTTMNPGDVPARMSDVVNESTLQLTDTMIRDAQARSRLIQRMVNDEEYRSMKIERRHELKEVKRWVQGCQECGSRKARPREVVPPLRSLRGGDIGDRWALDVAGPLPRKADRDPRFVIAAVEYVTRYAVAVVVGRHTAEYVAVFLMKQIVLKFGVFRALLTDGAPELTGHAIEQLVVMSQAEQINPVPYRPQMIGLVERFHRTWKDVVATFMQPEAQDDWSTWASHEVAEQARRREQQRQARYYNQKVRRKHEFKVGDRVWMFRPPRGPKASKFVHNWIGPLRVAEPAGYDNLLLWREDVEGVRERIIAHCSFLVTYRFPVSLLPKVASDLEEQLDYEDHGSVHAAATREAVSTTTAPIEATTAASSEKRGRVAKVSPEAKRTASEAVVELRRRRRRNDAEQYVLEYEVQPVEARRRGDEERRWVGVREYDELVQTDRVVEDPVCGEGV
ncbi:unnamed protein product [Phytophthora fragariaefolia]|uniref:Unnamed protein product n=1 Tax=Phytophthora fragariaefolia TaxID=1490495 RepID=A0A9W6YBR9_9STRA|nr:unnamed protein product [Phytophthora fragariaefolia]